jgi:tetratricopeptide (TPR) repeat protein
MRGWAGAWLIWIALGGSLAAENLNPTQAVPQSPTTQTQALPSLAGPSKDLAAPSTSITGEPFELPQLRHSFNLHLGVGLRWFTHADPSALPLGSAIATDGYGTADTLYPALDFSAGYQHPSGLGLEIGVSPEPLQQIYVMPLYRYATRGLGSRPLLQTLGLQVGWAEEDGGNGSYYDNSAAYYLNNQPVQMNTYAACYRLEQMLGARFSLGLELAYHYAVTQAQYTREPYDFSSPSTTVTNVLDYSGPSVKISLGIWPVAPYWTDRDQARVEDALAQRERRIEERLERIQARRRTVPGSDYATATEAEAAGGRLLDQGKLPEAMDAYEQATLLAPEDSMAWRGLANSEYALGKHARAYTHYKEALRLSPGDQLLRDFVDKLKSRLRMDGDLE